MKRNAFFTIILMAAAVAAQTTHPNMATLDASVPAHATPAALKSSFNPASVLAQPGLKCQVYATGSDSAKALTIYTDDDGYARFHAVHGAGMLTLDCTDRATGKFSIYTADLTSDATFAPNPVDLSKERGKDRPALKGDPMSFTSAELLAAGYGLRPDPKDAKAYAHWLAVASKPARMLSAKRDSPQTHTVTTATGTAWVGSLLTGNQTYLATAAYFNVPTAIPGGNETSNTKITIWNGVGGYAAPVLGEGGLIQGGVVIATSTNVASYFSFREYCCGDPDSDGFKGAFVPNPGDRIFSQEWYCDPQGNIDINGGYGCTYLQDETTGAVLNCTSATDTLCWSVQAMPLCSANPNVPNCMILGTTAEFVIENEIAGAPFTPLADQVEMDGGAWTTNANGYVDTVSNDPAVTLLTDFTNTNSHMIVTLGNDDQTYFNVSQFVQVQGGAQSRLVNCPGKVKECYPQAIAVGPNAYGSISGDAWVLSDQVDSNGNYYLFQWQNSKWVLRPGPATVLSEIEHFATAAGTQIAISPQGYPWIINNTGQVYYWNGAEFLLAPGNACATSIAVGPNAYGSKYGSAWIIGCDAFNDGNGTIYQLQGSTWVKQGTGANRIAVSPEGTPWVLDWTGNIYRGISLFSLFGAKTLEFVQVPGCASSISVGPNSDAWITGCQPQGDAGYNIYQLQSGSWVQVPGTGSQISVSPDFGIPWIVNFGDQIFR